MASNSMDYILNLIANNQQFNAGVNASKFAVNALVSAMAAVGIGASVQGLITVADEYATLQSRIKIAVGETGNFREAMAGVYQVAMQSNTSLESTANLFSRVYDTGKLMGLSQQQVLEVTKSINQAVQLSGGSAQSSEAAVTQLTQALQSGVLRGDEFNSIMEQAPTIAKTLAKELGVTTGELRNMAENGEISADRVIKAFQNQSASIQADFDKMPVTVGQALQKIQTAWMKLIGELNEDTGATNSISQFLVVISENLDALKPVIEDIKNAVGEVIERLQDTYTAERVELLKGMFTQVYDAVKSAVEAIWEIGSTIQDVFQTGLDLLSTFIFGVQESGKSIDLISVALGTINSVIGFISDGFKGITIALNLVLGVGYKISEWLYEFASYIPGVGERFEAMAKQAAEKSAEYFKKAHDQAMDFESQGIKAAENAVKTEQQRNEEKLANAKKTLEELAATDKQALADQEANNTRRKQLEAELAQAKADNNKVALEKIREQISELDIADDSFSKANIKRQADRLKAAQDYAENAIKANNGILTDEAQNNLKILGFIAEQSEAQKNAAEVTVQAMDKGKQAAEGFGLAASVSAEKAAKALGIDLDVALNQVSKSFAETEKQVDIVVNGFDDLKNKGVDASNLIYQGWVKWLEKAKSQAEIDLAKAKLLEFEKQGIFSTKQVEMGMQALRQVIQKLPDDIDPVEQAFERLGIKTKEQLKLMAQSAIADFNTVVSSGRATAEDTRKAAERVAQAAIASGDQIVISQAKAKAATAGLNLEIDATGKVAIQSYEEIVLGSGKAERAVNRIGSGYANIGNAATSASRVTTAAAQQAINSLDEWAAKLDAIKAKDGGTVAGKDGSTNLNQTGMQGYTEQQIYDKLVAAGYDNGRAKAKASELYRNTSWAATSFGFSDVPGQVGGNDLTNFNYVNQQIAALSKNQSASVSGVTNPERVVQVNLNNGGQNVPVTVPSGQETNLINLLQQSRMVSG